MAATSEVMSRVRLLAYLDTLYYLWKGGRVPGIAHVATSLLRLKPLFELREGEVRNLARPRTRNRAATRLMRLMKERVEGDEQGLEEARFQVRWLDDLLCVHAGDWHGQRSHGRLLSVRGTSTLEVTVLLN